MRLGMQALASLIALGFVNPASAADLVSRTATRLSAKAPAYLAPIYDWTGFYIGVFGGGGRSQINRTDAFGSTSYGGNGGTAGVTAGYNWQNRNLMFGAEADLGWTDLGGQNDTAAALRTETHSRWLSSIRGRIGIVANQWLFFGTGGLAFTNSQHVSMVPGAAADIFSSTNIGWTAGGGAEYAITPNWSAKLEYRHFDFDSLRRDYPVNGSAHYTVKNQFDTVTAGVNYKWGGPLVAKY